MDAICLAVPYGGPFKLTGKRLGVDKSSLRRTMRRDGPRYKQELLDSSVAAVPCTSAFGGADITEGGRCPISQVSRHRHSEVPCCTCTRELQSYYSSQPYGVTLAL